MTLYERLNIEIEGLVWLQPSISDTTTSYLQTSCSNGTNSDQKETLPRILAKDRVSDLRTVQASEALKSGIGTAKVGTAVKSARRSHNIREKGGDKGQSDEDDNETE